MNKYNLHLGDCLELMKQIPDKSIDMILCDLPYGVTQNKQDIALPFNDYIVVNSKKYKKEDYLLMEYKKGTNYEDALRAFNNNKSNGLWSLYERIIKDNGIIILFGQGKFYTKMVESNKELFKYDLVWNKKLATGFLNAKRMPLRSHEQIAVFYKKLPVYNPIFTEGQPLHSKGVSYNTKEIKNQNYGKFNITDDSRKGSTQKYPTSILNFAKPHPSIAKHRTQKSVELLEYLIRTFTNKEDVVLDNCMGSGSTGIACINTNRKFIGIELDEKCFDIAKERIENREPPIT